MFKRAGIFLLLALAVHIYWNRSAGILMYKTFIDSKASTFSSPSYIGAVVEYHPVINGYDGRVIALQNAENVRTIVKKASEFNVDIIVFPEVGISALPAKKNWPLEKIRKHHYYAASYIPSPNENSIICDTDGKYAQSLKTVSCAARDYQMYIVVNHHEKLDCPEPNCSPDNFLLYNTNVVFDREGRLIARYRKYNLFDEPALNITSKPEISIFNTDFGVTFGQIICNDISFMNPAFDLLNKYHIKDFVYVSAWNSELPFLVSIETHSAWAYVNDVNLLSSGYNEPAIQRGGSVIYLGGNGILNATLPNVAANQLIVGEVPKIYNGQRQHLSRPLRSHIYRFSLEEISSIWIPSKARLLKADLRPYTTELVDFKQTSFKKTICDRGLCCDFGIEIDFDKNLAVGNKYYRYRMGVFNGTEINSGIDTIGLEVCGIFFCYDETLGSCGERFTSDNKVVYPTNFRSISIKRAEDNNLRKFYLPLTLTADLMPLDTSTFSFIKFKSNVDKKIKSLEMTLKESERKLWTFTIYGRNVAADGFEPSKPYE